MDLILHFIIISRMFVEWKFTKLVVRD